jgi:L-proline amide hydrolase
VLRRCEASGTTDDPADLAAAEAWYERYIAPRHPQPEPPDARDDGQPVSDEIYRTLTGPLEFQLQGPLGSFEVSDRLGEIDVPTLITSGRYDAITDCLVNPVHEGIRGSEWVVFEASAHMAHLDEPERYRAVLEAFLARHEP